jgi:membrane-bound lytic murein transglycosylase B
LQAYATAELAQRARTPDCRLSGATLAGIGRVESDHARINGSRLDRQGVSSPPIVGIPLDGSDNTREIADTDGGRLDGDTTYDRAVGPLQFLPTTWARYGGGGDPQQIDDAARAAAAYLCAEGRDIASGDGWWDGVLAYNRSVEYARLVWASAGPLRRCGDLRGSATGGRPPAPTRSEADRVAREPDSPGVVPRLARS